MSVEQLGLDFDALDEEYQHRIELVAGDWLRGDEDGARFVCALMDARRGPLDLINQDDVRQRLTEDTVKGPRIAINPNRYSALWNTCCKQGLIRKHVDIDGKPIKRPATTSTTGNNGKEFFQYRWIGGAQ